MRLELLETDVPSDTKRQIITQEMQLWRNTRFQTESRRRVYGRIGDSRSEAEQVRILEQCEGALMDLSEQLSALET